MSGHYHDNKRNNQLYRSNQFRTKEKKSAFDGALHLYLAANGWWRRRRRTCRCWRSCFAKEGSRRTFSPFTHLLPV